MCTKCQRMKQKLQKSCISEDGEEGRIREPQQQQQREQGANMNTHSSPADADADEGQQKQHLQGEEKEEVNHDDGRSADEYSIRSTASATTEADVSK